MTPGIPCPSVEGTVVATNRSSSSAATAAPRPARMQSAYGLTDAQRRSLEAAGRDHFLLLAGSRRLGIHVEVPPLQDALLTTPATARG
jgi:hypothetical protein